MHLFDIEIRIRVNNIPLNILTYKPSPPLAFESVLNAPIPVPHIYPQFPVSSCSELIFQK